MEKTRGATGRDKVKTRWVLSPSPARSAATATAGFISPDRRNARPAAASPRSEPTRMAQQTDTRRINAQYMATQRQGHARPTPIRLNPPWLTAPQGRRAGLRVL